MRETAVQGAPARTHAHDVIIFLTESDGSGVGSAEIPDIHQLQNQLADQRSCMTAMHPLADFAGGNTLRWGCGGGHTSAQTVTGTDMTNDNVLLARNRPDRRPVSAPTLPGYAGNDD